jgi:hypothetical protein
MRIRIYAPFYYKSHRSELSLVVGNHAYVNCEETNGNIKRQRWDCQPLLSLGLIRNSLTSLFSYWLQGKVK